MDMTDLDHLQRPRFHVPFALRYTSHVVVNEEAFGLDLENKAVGDFAYACDELGNGFGEEVVEEVHGFDDNLVRVGCRVWAAVGAGWCCSRSGLRGGIRGFGILRGDVRARGC